MEKSEEQDVDRVSGCFGKIMEEIFAYREEYVGTCTAEWDFSGEIIYLMDAYDDVEDDVKRKLQSLFHKVYNGRV